MAQNYVDYRDHRLAKNSLAYELHEKKDFKALDKHLKMLEANEKALIERYRTKTHA